MSSRPRALLLWPIAACIVIAASIGSTVHAGQVSAQTEAAAERWYAAQDESRPAPATATPGPSETTQPAKVSAVAELQTRLVSALAEADAGAPAPPGIDWNAHQKDVFQETYRCVAWWEQSKAEICPVGDTATKRTVVLAGDSHAGQWISTMDALGRRDGFRVIYLVKPGCNAYEVAQYRWGSDAPDVPCQEFKTWVRSVIADVDPEAVIVTARGFDSMRSSGAERERLWRTGVEAGIRSLMDLGPEVYVVSDAPARSSKPDDCLTSPGASLADCITTKSGKEIVSNPLTEAAAKAAGAHWVDASPLICVEDRCPLAVDGRVTYYDDNHLSVSWAREIAPAMGELLGF